jgi:hypothetical protein
VPINMERHECRLSNVVGLGGAFVVWCRQDASVGPAGSNIATLAARATRSRREPTNAVHQIATDIQCAVLSRWLLGSDG